MTVSPYDQHLEKNPANYQPLTPLMFIERAASVYPTHTAVIHGSMRYSWSEFYDRCRRLASALARLQIGPGDTVSVMLSNTPPMLEAHYAIPMLGAVIHSINTRLDPPIIAFQLDHAESKVSSTMTISSFPRPAAHCPTWTMKRFWRIQTQISPGACPKTNGKRYR